MTNRSDTWQCCRIHESEETGIPKIAEGPQLAKISHTSVVSLPIHTTGENKKKKIKDNAL